MHETSGVGQMVLGVYDDQEGCLDGWLIGGPYFTKAAGNVTGR